MFILKPTFEACEPVYKIGMPARRGVPEPHIAVMLVTGGGGPGVHRDTSTCRASSWAGGVAGTQM